MTDSNHKVVVRKFYRRGCRINQYGKTKAFQRLLAYKPHYIYLIIKGNDLKANINPINIEHKLTKLVLFLEASTGAFVKLADMEYRQEEEGKRTVEGYLKARTNVNNKLKRSKLLRNKCMHLPFKKELQCDDGIHLSQYGINVMNRVIKHKIERCMQRHDDLIANMRRAYRV